MESSIDKGAQKGESKVSPKATFVEMDAKDSPVKDINWQAHQVETKSDPIRDPGTGQALIVRNFFFKAPPREKGKPTPSKREIIESQKHYMGMTLYGDGLSPLEDKAVKLYTKKELKSGILKSKLIQEGADFVIVVVATPRQGVAVAERPNILT